MQYAIDSETADEGATCVHGLFDLLAAGHIEVDG